MTKHTFDQSTSNSSFKTYLKEVHQCPLLTPEEEIQCGTVIQRQPHSAAAGAARERLITGNLRWVLKLASKYTRPPLNRYDAVQEGNLGLIAAVERFDPLRFDNRFATYATCWIVAAIREAITRAALIRIPSRSDAQLRKIRHCASYDPLLDQNDVAVIAEESGLSPADVAKCLGLNIQLVSLQATPDGVDENLESAIPNPDDHPVDELIATEEHGIVRVALNHLGDGEAEMVRQFFGLDTTELPVREIARLHGLTRQRVQLVLKRSLRKLRSLLARKLRGPVDHLS